ncbi:MAG: Uma2 family endonuclease [Verrucomicrobiota bacterium]
MPATALPIPKEKEPAIPAHPLIELSESPLVFDSTWEFYLDLRNLFDEHGRTRTKLTFYDGVLEIMSPPVSEDHESRQGNISRIVDYFCLELDITYDSLGGTTWLLPERRGAEADASYIFGERGPKKYPDLVIEVKITSGGIDKLDVYAPYEIPEVWVWENGVLHQFEFVSGSYAEIEESKLLPGLPKKWIEEISGIRPASDAVKELRSRLAERAQSS